MFHRQIICGWLYKADQAARAHHAKGKTRESFDDLLGDVGGKTEKEQLHYKTLFNKLAKNSDILPKVDKATAQKIDELRELSLGISDAVKRVPNPSGTTVTQEAINFIKKMGAGVAAGLTGTFVGIPSALGVAALQGTAAYISTNKKFLKAAMNFARKPTPTLANRLNFIAKSEFKTNLVGLRKTLDEEGQE